MEVDQQQGQLNPAQPALSAAAPPKPRRGGWLAGLMVLCVVVSVGALAIEFIFGRSFESVGPDFKLLTITVIDRWLTQAVWYVFLGCLAALVLLGVVAFLRKYWLSGVASIVGALALFCAAVFFAVLIAMFNSPWAVVDQCRGPDGKQYAYLYFGPALSQGQTLLLGRESRQNGWQATYDVLGETNGDSPSSWTAVIRPSDCSGSDGSLLLAPGGWLVGLKYDNKCYFAYEVSTGKFLAHESVKDISPLILLGPDTEPLASDVAAILSAGENVPGTCARPIADLRAEAARHPNAKIREMLKAMPSASTNPKGAAGPGALSLPTESTTYVAGRRETRQPLECGGKPRRGADTAFARTGADSCAEARSKAAKAPCFAEASQGLSPHSKGQAAADAFYGFDVLSPLQGSCSLFASSGGLRPRLKTAAPSGLRLAASAPSWLKEAFAPASGSEI